MQQYHHLNCEHAGKIFSVTLTNWPRSTIYNLRQAITGLNMYKKYQKPTFNGSHVIDTGGWIKRWKHKNSENS